LAIAAGMRRRRGDWGRGCGPAEGALLASGGRRRGGVWEWRQTQEVGGGWGAVVDWMEMEGAEARVKYDNGPWAECDYGLLGRLRVIRGFRVL
jgi:hypothetical protein